MCDTAVKDAPSPKNEAPRSNRTFESAILSFWAGLAAARADRAALRRCATPAEVVFVPAFHRLLRELDADGTRVAPERLAVIAAVIAHIEEHRPAADFASQLATGIGGKPGLGGLRFRRLLAIDSPGELLTYLIRTVRLLDRCANVVDLAWSIRSWNDTVRKRWAFRYYEKSTSD